MIIIGLTGSIAMGKSEVAKIFRTLSIPVFDADAEVHALYDSAKGVKLLANFIPDAIKKGRVDQAKLSAIVLHDPQLLDQLEIIVHTEVATRRKEFLQKAKSKSHNIVVLDIPLLFEKATDIQVDATIVVSAPSRLQQERALARPGMTKERLKLILARQMSDVEKRKKADYIIENDGSLPDLEIKTKAILSQIMNKQESSPHDP